MYLSGFLLLFASWMQPLHILPWVSWHSEVLAFLAALCFAWALVFSQARKRATSTISLPVAARPLLWLCLLIGVQWGIGLIPFIGDVLVDWAYLLLCIACLVWGYHSSRDKSAMVVGMATVLLAGALVSAVIALLQALELSSEFAWINSMPDVRRPGANLGQPNQLATLLLMGIASLLFLLESKKLGAIPAFLMALVLVISLAATESRAGVLGFLVLSLWWFAKHKSIAAQLKPWVVVLVGATYLGLYWYWPVLMGEFYQLPDGLVRTNAVAFNRWFIWPQLMQAALLHPWLGWGVGQVSTAQNAVVDAYSVSESYTYAHNIVLDLALGIGLPLTLLIVLMTGVWQWRRVRASGDMVSWYCLAVAIPVAVHSMVEFPFAYAYFLVPVMFALGALDAHLGFQPSLKWGIKPVAIGLAIGTTLLVWSAFEYQAVEEDFRVVRFEALRVGQTPQDYERPHIHLLSQLDALLYGGRVTPRPGMPEQEIELVKIVALRYPWPATQNRYALALALNGNPVEATRQLRVMRAQHGAKAYAKIKAAWATLATEKYPQLNAIQLP
ncbi:MAG: O-antigen ligase C-terminal domain-containing protein [Burkholderiales bacterium]|nr:O-antigen ligase C-terminal domain-containing protein [Burkholderiales bacterium]